MIIYPDEFPKPQMDGYSIGVDMGVLRTEFDTGRNRQRRNYKTMPHTFGFSFAVAIADLYAWLNWVNANAYEWFQLDAASFLTGAYGGNCSPHMVRFISDISMTPISQKFMQVTVAAEMVDPLSDVPTSQVGVWIIGGTPDLPSIDWFIAGEPDMPSIDFTNPGTPQYPSVLV